MDFIEIGRRTLSNENMSLSNLLRPSYIKVFRSYFNLLSFIYSLVEGPFGLVRLPQANTDYSFLVWRFVDVYKAYFTAE